MPHTTTPSPRPTSQPSGPRDRLSADPETLFVYGTLRFPDVLRALVDRVPVHTSAAAHGWRAAALPGRVYPGLVPSNSSATGLLLTGLTPGEWCILDAFEDDLYELQRLTLNDNRHGWAYICANHTDASPRNWNADHFAARHLPAYINHCHTWRHKHTAGT